MHCLLYKCYSYLSMVGCVYHQNTQVLIYCYLSLTACQLFSHCLSFWVASFPGLSTVQFVICCLVCKTEGEGLVLFIIWMVLVSTYVDKVRGRGPQLKEHILHMLTYFTSPTFKTSPSGTETTRKDLKLIFVNREPFPPSVDTDIIQGMKWTRPYLDSGKA